VIIPTKDSKVNRHVNQHQLQTKSLRYVSSEYDPRFSQNTKAPYEFSKSEPKCGQLSIDHVSQKKKHNNDIRTKHLHLNN
jgi:hypothetical protein